MLCVTCKYTLWRCVDRPAVPAKRYELAQGVGKKARGKNAELAAMTFLQWHLLSLKMAGTGYDASSSSTINQLVCGLMENPHFLDVLERTSRRINSPQMTSQPAASCSTSSSRPFQTPVEEFRSLFRTGTASSTSIPRFHTRRPVGMSFEDNLFFLMGVFHQSAN